MAIESKIVYAKTKSTFESLKSSIPANLNPIVFIEDTKEVWTCGTYFNLGYPSLLVTEENSIVNITLNDSIVSLIATGDGLSIRKGTGNRIVFNSTSLSSILTEDPLEWLSAERKLIHKESNVVLGTYGPTSQIENASTFQVPYFSVDKYGHIQLAGTTNIGIRDYVEQKAPSTVNQEKSLLLSSNVGLSSDTTSSEKSTATYNNVLGVLTIPGGLNVTGKTNMSGDLEVTNGYIIGTLQGSVTGDATPKIHADLTPKYGGASLNLYGHVKLQDEFAGIPDASSSNENPNSLTTERGIAASPRLVWNTKTALETLINSKPSIGSILVGTQSLNINTTNQVVEFTGVHGLKINLVDNKIQLNAIQLSGKNSLGNIRNIDDSLLFGDDFLVSVDNELSLNWLEIE